MVKTVNTKCETCGGPHSFTECPSDGGYTQETAYATTGNYNSGGNSCKPQSDCNLLSYRSSNYLGPPDFNQPNMQNRYSQNQNQGNFQAPNHQAPNNHEIGQNFNQGSNNFQAPNFQASKFQVGPSNELTTYIKSNEAVLRDMRTQMTNMKTELRNEFKSTIDARTNKIETQNNQIMNILTNMQMKNSLGLGSLPSNTVPNPRADVKAITTWSGVTLVGPSVSPPPSKEVDREPELITNQKLFDLATTLVNENYSAVILKKLPEKLGDPGKFLIPCDFPEFDECLALADLVVDYVVDPRVPLILERPFLRTRRALIDVYGEELTLRVDDEAITFKVGQTSKYSYNDAESINRIDVIDVAYEEYVQEVLGFSDKSKSGTPTLTLDPIISSSSPSFTPFEGSDFILEEIETFLRTLDEFSNLDNDYYDTEGDIIYLEKVLNEDPSPNIPLVKTEDLNQVNATMTKPLIEEPLELELKELPSHLEYAFLEGTDKLPVIISKELKDEEKSALLKILKSHKRAIAWRIFDIKGIDPCFCTHKILMEDDFKPAVQHQIRVNQKIHDVIKKEVIKLLDTGLIYPIFDSLWVSPVHCVPKNGGMIALENDNNEFIPTRHVPKVHDGHLPRYDRENYG
nr:reverse transcriptase domain-containing protein, chloroplastic [Tanacetum cinerariifolium]